MIPHRTSFGLLCVLALAACSDATSPSTETDGGFADAGEADASDFEPDANPDEDMAVLPDMTTPEDMTVTPDMAASCDAPSRVCDGVCAACPTGGAIETACEASTCVAVRCDSSSMLLSGSCVPMAAIAQQAYVKASNTGEGDRFGTAIALSADGNTLAVSAASEDSNATGVGGSQGNNRTDGAGAVYVFERSGTMWTQTAYIKASNTGENDFFGMSLALSGDGTTLVVGASHEDSAASGVDGNAADNTLTDAGAVYVFTRSAGTWSQEAYIKASNPATYDRFGEEVAVSFDGNTLAVGAHQEDSASPGVGGNQSNNDAEDSGAVYVFTRSAGAWSQEAYIKASNPGENDSFGSALSLSSDGRTLAVGAFWESSNATGVGGNQSNNSLDGAGAVYVFVRSGSTWAQQAYVKASNTGRYDTFGIAVALSANGDVLVVGADGESSNSTSVGGDQANNDASFSGAAYVFVRSGAAWSQEAYVKASNAQENDNFGREVAISADGSLVAVSTSDDSGASGIDGDRYNNTASSAGAVVLFERSGVSWSEVRYVKASNTDALDSFGTNLALSGDGLTLAVGADGEQSSATGVNGDQADDGMFSAGAAYVFYGTP